MPVDESVMTHECSINWYGPNKMFQVEIGKDIDRFFDENIRHIEIEIDGKIYHSNLPNSFFSTCKHFRTAYDNESCKGKNYLNNWIAENEVKRAKLEAIEKPKRYRLSKIE